MEIGSRLGGSRVAGRGSTFGIRPSTFAAALALVAAVLVGEGAQAQQIDVIPPSGEWVTDRGDFLSDAEERALTQKLRQYEDSTSTQIVIVTLPSLEGNEPADYATALGREWQVGQEGQDNGVVILLSSEEREVFIATGYGLEGAIPDAIASRIVRNVMVPRFREGNYYAGLDAAVDHLVAAATGEFTAEQIRGPGREGEGAFDGASLFVLLIIAFFVINAIRHSNRGGGDGGKRVRRSRGHGPLIIWGGGGWGGGSSGGFGGGGFGGFGGGGGSFGGGGAGGGW